MDGVGVLAPRLPVQRGKARVRGLFRSNRARLGSTYLHHAMLAPPLVLGDPNP